MRVLKFPYFGALGATEKSPLFALFQPGETLGKILHVPAPLGLTCLPGSVAGAGGETHGPWDPVVEEKNFSERPVCLGQDLPPSEPQLESGAPDCQEVSQQSAWHTTHATGEPARPSQSLPSWH